MECFATMRARKVFLKVLQCEAYKYKEVQSEAILLERPYSCLINGINKKT